MPPKKKKSSTDVAPALTERQIMKMISEGKDPFAIQTETETEIEIETETESKSKSVKATKKNSKKPEPEPELEPEDQEGESESESEDDEPYCICRLPSKGAMIACDNEVCFSLSHTLSLCV